MNVPISIHKKGLASALIIGLMVVTVSYAATSFFFFAPNFETRAYAQEDNNNNNTRILEDMRAILLDQQRDISSIKNTSSASTS